jgi:hypothetical protein
MAARLVECHLANAASKSSERNRGWTTINNEKEQKKLER